LPPLQDVPFVALISPQVPPLHVAVLHAGALQVVHVPPPLPQYAVAVPG
jgi:hypothetical protein